MIKSIVAGFMIALAAAIYLTVGGALGAFMFAIGLLTILFFQFNLFTGKAGLLAQRQIKPSFLAAIWIGNLIGCALCSLLLLATPLGSSLAAGAAAITLTRISNLWFENIILGVFCGVLMYIGVKQYPIAPYVTILSVASFILLGANHCIADMAYMFLAANTKIILPASAALLCTTAGNIIGCNIIPLIQSSQKQSVTSSS